MGILDFMYSSNAPDLTPVKDACLRSYGYSWTAVNGVRDNVVEGVNKHYPDNETQAKIGRIAAKIGRIAAKICQNTADYALQETLKIIPGRNAFDKIVLPAFRDEEMTLEPAKILEGVKEFASENALPLDLVANQKPEDVIRIFMMNGLTGRNTFDALMVPVTRRGTNQK